MVIKAKAIKISNKVYKVIKKMHVFIDLTIIGI